MFFFNLSDSIAVEKQRLGAAVDDPANELSPHRLRITDRSGVEISLGSSPENSATAFLGQTVHLSAGGKAINLSLEKAGIFQFDVDYDAQTLVISCP